MKATIAERGQVTIPKALRQKLGLKSGTVLDFQVQNSVLIAIKAEQCDPVDQVYGCLNLKLNTNAVMDNLRGKM